ncbi:hypothetical protein PR048_007537 [Dryococelus australis]|uniref:Uncharacterized protein n=1 Tax=Dryococelus australis TaxID=614101 RepID=A0ABQ9HVE2_9NEOP|nr:hypothetical protein PR048_007537 [Dryococelus australis]
MTSGREEDAASRHRQLMLERRGESASDHQCELPQRDPFGDKSKLKEFIDNVEAVVELTNPRDHEQLLRFVKAKMTREANTKLLARTAVDSWEGVRDILEEYCAVRRTLDYYACRMFGVRQVGQDTVADWGSRIDVGSEKTSARVLTREEMSSTQSLIDHLAKACFVQGLANEKVQLVVRSKSQGFCRLCVAVMGCAGGGE